MGEAGERVVRGAVRAMSLEPSLLAHRAPDRGGRVTIGRGTLVGQPPLINTAAAAAATHAIITDARCTPTGNLLMRSPILQAIPCGKMMRVSSLWCRWAAGARRWNGFSGACPLHLLTHRMYRLITSASRQSESIRFLFWDFSAPLERSSSYWFIFTAPLE